MKTFQSLLLLLALLTHSLLAQNAKKILKKSFDKCQLIQNGYYEMDEYTKYLSSPDTVKRSTKSYFKKVSDENAPNPFLFSVNTFFSEGCINSYLYNGMDYIRMNPKDSTVTTMSIQNKKREIKSEMENIPFFYPLVTKSSKPISFGLETKKYEIKLIGLEKVENMGSYHLEVTEILKPIKESTNEPELIGKKYHIWIKKEDYLPIQFSEQLDLLIGRDTLVQYKKYVLKKIEINSLVNESVFQVNTIPSFYAYKQELPQVSYPPLPNDTLAPNWHLTSLDGEKVALSDLKGQLVLVDFFYKSCYPCMLSIPELQELHEKYGDKGLKIVGINPYDTDAKDLKSFLSKKGVSYTVLLGGGEVAKEYRVSGYPTLYLIDKEGKIIFNLSGYGKQFKEQLEELIIKNLN